MRPCGALRTPVGSEYGRPINKLVGRLSSFQQIPESILLKGPWTTIPDQFGESCLGHTYIQAFKTISKGKIVASAMALYSIAQWLENTTQKRLPNRGAFTNKILEAVENFGIVKQSRWIDSSDPTMVVPQDVFEAGNKSLVNGIYRINEKKEPLKLRIKQSLSQGYPIPYAQEVDEGIMRFKGDGVWNGLIGPVVGAHAQCIIGYDPSGVIAAGSWGTKFAANGIIKISWDFITSKSTFDFQVVTLAPGAVF